MIPVNESRGRPRRFFNALFSGGFQNAVWLLLMGGGIVTCLLIAASRGIRGESTEHPFGMIGILIINPVTIVAIRNWRRERALFLRLCEFERSSQMQECLLALISIVCGIETVPLAVLHKDLKRDYDREASRIAADGSLLFEEFLAWRLFNWLTKEKIINRRLPVIAALSRKEVLRNFDAFRRTVYSAFERKVNSQGLTILERTPDGLAITAGRTDPEFLSILERWEGSATTRADLIISNLALLASLRWNFHGTSALDGTKIPAPLTPDEVGHWLIESHERLSSTDFDGSKPSFEEFVEFVRNSVLAMHLSSKPPNVTADAILRMNNANDEKLQNSWKVPK